MRRLLLLCLTTVYSGLLIGLPIANPTESGMLTNGVFIYSYGCYDMCDPCFKFMDAWSARMGFYGDYVFNRHLKVHAGSSPSIQTSEIFTNAAYFALDFCNKVDLFGTLGVSNFSFQGNTNSFPTFLMPDQYFEVQFRPEFSWSVGGRGIIWELSSLGVGIEAQYFRSTPQIDTILTGDGNLITYPSSLYALYTEWQVGVGAAFRFEVNCPDVALVPYMGISWSSAKMTLRQRTVELLPPDATLTFLDLKSQKPWSYAVGTTLALFEMVEISVEGRFAGESALYVNGQFRF